MITQYLNHRGKNLDVPGLLKVLRQACQNAGFKSENYAVQRGFPLFACSRIEESNQKTVYISSGMHGDEPAGPLALLEILEEKSLPEAINFVVCPLLNPAGLSLGNRENESGVDLNRDYLKHETAEVSAHISWLDKQPRFDLAILMHEDWESPGFYINDFVCTEHSAPVARAILSAVAEVCPINDEAILDGRPALEGVACTSKDRYLKTHWTECFYLRKNEAALCFNFESPTGLPLETRIAGQMTALRKAIDLISKQA